jgi:polysaccharide pyruvyl transferase WcaK-like protein
MKKGLHIAPVSPNSGDIYLVEAAERVISNGDIQWTRQDCRKLVDRKMVNDINSKYDFIVLGPGGILMLDEVNGKGIAKSNKMSIGAMLNVSGYQWLIKKEDLLNIKIPMIVFSIGWNYFRGLYPKREPFASSVKTLIDHSSYFSMRHSGDIKDLCEFINYNNDVEKIKLCYCPTIISDGTICSDKDSNIVGFQIANDRWTNRYADSDKLFNEIYKTIIDIEKMGYKIDVIDQCVDGKFIDWMTSRKLWKPSFRKVVLKGKPYEEQSKYYKTLNTIFATRGHGQMIPMGLGVKVISIISHNKLKYFLEDTKLEWTGIESDVASNADFIEIFNNTRDINFSKEIDTIKLSIDKEVQEIRKIILST